MTMCYGVVEVYYISCMPPFVSGDSRSLSNQHNCYVQLQISCRLTHYLHIYIKYLSVFVQELWAALVKPIYM